MSHVGEYIKPLRCLSASESVVTDRAAVDLFLPKNTFAAPFMAAASVV